MRRDTPDEALQLRGKTTYFPIDYLIQEISQLKLHGYLKCDDGMQQVTICFYDGTPLYCYQGNANQLFYDQLPRNLLSDGQKLDALTEYLRKNPNHYLEALTSLDVNESAIIQYLERTMRKALFFMVFETDLDFFFNEERADIFPPDPQLLSLLRRLVNNSSISERFNHLCATLNKKPQLLDDTLVFTSDTQANDALLTKFDGQNSVAAILRYATYTESFTFFEQLEMLIENNMIRWLDEAPYQKQHDLIGLDKRINALLEIYQGIIPFLFNNQLSLIASANSIWQEAISEAAKWYPQIFVEPFSFRGIDAFIQLVRERIFLFNSVEIVSSTKKVLNLLLLQLMKGVLKEQGLDYFTASTNKMSAFLSFIRKHGSYEQQQGVKMIYEIMDLAEKIFQYSEPSSHELLDTFQRKISDIFTTGDVLDSYRLYRKHEQKYRDGREPTIITELKNATLELLRTRTGPLHRYAIAKRTMETAEITGKIINPDDAFLLSLVDSPTQLKDLMYLTSFSEIELRFHIYELQQKDLIVLADEREKLLPYVKKRVTLPEKVQIEDSSTYSAEAHSPANEKETRTSSVTSDIADAIVKQLKKELHQLKSSTPQDIFEIPPEMPLDAFKNRVTNLKDRYSAEYFDAALREHVEPIIEKIHQTITQAASQIEPYLAKRKMSPAVNEHGKTAGREEQIEITVDHAEITRDVPKSVFKAPTPVQTKEKRRDQAKTQMEVKSNKKVEAQKLYQQGLTLRREGKFDEAIELFKQAITLTPQNFAIHRTLELTLGEKTQKKGQLLINRLKQAMEKKEWNSAKKIAKQVIELNISDRSTFLVLGELFGNHLNKLKDSEYFYRRAIDMEPAKVEPYICLGRLFKNHGLLIQAREILQEGLSWNKRHPELRKELNTLP